VTPHRQRSPAEPIDTDTLSSRVLGRATATVPGPTLICIGGVHGNEPAGLLAMNRVLGDLERSRGPARGELLALAGNLAGLAAGRRYIEHDLNRGWTRDRLTHSPTPQPADASSSEARERLELLRAIRSAATQARGPVYVLDIHTTSSHSAPFLLIGDTLSNRRFARHFPIPIILGLEEHLDGTIGEYLTERGFVSLSVEAGQHESHSAVDNAAAAVWIALAALGLVREPLRPVVRRARAHLIAASRGLPGVLEVVYRYPLTSGHAFTMKPGFHNFARIRPGDLLARHHQREVHSRWDARLLMPLYQDLGEDGFFVVQRVRPFWMGVSAALRRLRLDRFVHWLPGIKRHGSRPETLVVDRRVARWQAMQVLHLLGFRKRREIGGVLLVSRRRVRRADADGR